MLSLLALISVAPGLEERIKEVLPTKLEEKWLSIPWRTNMMRARADAQRDGKPMFMWIMNGSPLGCT